jgi:hypothetical protein
MEEDQAASAIEAIGHDSRERRLFQHPVTSFQHFNVFCW